jgi:hypothetical protein
VASLWRTLLPITLGHLAAMGLVVAGVLLGHALDRALVQVAAGTLLAIVLLLGLRRRTGAPVRAPSGQAGLALWSFLVSSAHGAGLALVPALVPLCAVDLASAPGNFSWDALAMALPAVGAHAAAMLAVSGAMAFGACRGLRALAAVVARLRRLSPPSPPSCAPLRPRP